MIIGGEYVKASPIECLFNQCYKEDSDKNTNGIETDDIKVNIPADDTTHSNTSLNENNLPPPPSNTSNSTPMNNTNIPPPPPSNDSNSTPMNNANIPPIQSSNNSNTENLPHSNEQVPPSKSFLGNLREGVSKVGDKFRNSFKSKDPDEPKRTMVGRIAGWAGNALLNQQVKELKKRGIKIDDDLVKMGSNAITQSSRNLSAKQAISGAKGIQSFSQGDMENAFNKENVNTIIQGVDNIARQGKGGKKRKSKKRTNKKRKTNKKRSKK